MVIWTCEICYDASSESWAYAGNEGNEEPHESHLTARLLSVTCILWRRIEEWVSVWIIVIRTVVPEWTSADFQVSTSVVHSQKYNPSLLHAITLASEGLHFHNAVDHRLWSKQVHPGAWLTSLRNNAQGSCPAEVLEAVLCWGYDHSGSWEVFTELHWLILILEAFEQVQVIDELMLMT